MLFDAALAAWNAKIIAAQGALFMNNHAGQSYSKRPLSHKMGIASYNFAIKPKHTYEIGPTVTMKVPVPVR